MRLRPAASCKLLTFLLLIFVKPCYVYSQSLEQFSEGNCSPNLGNITGNVMINCDIRRQGVPLKAETEYFISEKGFLKTLFSRTDGKTYKLYDVEGSLLIEDVRDYDLDGYLDVMVSETAGGNCCAPSFSIFSYRGYGIFKKLTHEQFYSWDDPIFEFVDDRWRVRVETGVDGVGNSTLEINMAIFEIRDGTLKMIESASQKATVPSLVELSSEPYANGNVADNHLMRMTFDLDGDSRDDMIQCGYWERWGALSCDIFTSRLGKVEMVYGCDRLGIIDEVASGLNKLVCNSDSILAYDRTNNSYEFE